MNRPGLLATATLALLIPLLHGCGTTTAPLPLSSPTFEKALAILQTQAHSGDASVRANCMEASQVSHDPRAIAIIQEGLHDSEWVVRFSAAMACGNMKNENAATVRPVLNTLVVHDPSGSVRAGCIYSLRRFGDTTHMSDLATLLDALDYPTQANSAMVLGLMGDDSAIPLLQMHKNNPDIRVRFELTAALARLGEIPSQEIVAGWAVNKFAEDQWNAMTVCGDLPASVGRSPLLLGLEDAPTKFPPGMSDADKEAVKRLTLRRQLVAARSLAKMRDGAGSKIALDNLINDDPSMRGLAVLAVGEMIDSRQAPGLKFLLDDPDESVRRAAAAAVVKIYARAASGL